MLLLLSANLKSRSVTFFPDFLHQGKWIRIRVFVRVHYEIQFKNSYLETLKQDFWKVVCWKKFWVMTSG